MADFTLSKTRADRDGALAAPVSARVYEGRVARTHGPTNPLVYPARPAFAQNEYRRIDQVENIVRRGPGVPVVVLHPRRADGSAHLLKDGAQPKIVGYVVEARVDDEHAIFRFVLTEPEGEDALERGIRELSLGYEADAGPESGWYQAITHLDHLALVPRARCGASCQVRVDCEDDPEGTDDGTCVCKNHAVKSDENPAPALGAQDQKDNSHMDETTRKQLADALEKAAKAEARADAAERELVTIKTKLETERSRADNAERDRDKARVDSEDEIKRVRGEADKARVDAADAASAGFAERLDLVKNADAILGTTDDKGNAINHASAKPRDLMVQIIKRVDGADVSADDGDLYVKGMYDGARRRFAATSASLTDVRASLAAPAQRLDAASEVNGLAVGRDAEKQARKNMNDRASSAHTTETK